MKTIFIEASLVNLTDDALLELIGFCFEEGKRVEERMKADPHIQRVTEELAHYKKENYTEIKKAYRAKLKAARKLAEARNLHFKLPKEASDED